MPDSVTTIVSTKGQVILPKAVRDHLRWPPGTKLVVEETGTGVLLRAAPIFPPTRPEDVFGSLRSNIKPKTLAEMDEAVLAEAASRYARD